MTRRRKNVLLKRLGSISKKVNDTLCVCANDLGNKNKMKVRSFIDSTHNHAIKQRISTLLFFLSLFLLCFF